MANILIGHVKGPQGDAATVSVGTTTTGAAGSSASVTNSGTSSAAVLNFTIPKGDKGDAGTPGVTDYATTSAAGLVRVGDDFNINSSNGTLSIKNAFTEASTLANIASGESQATILGKIKKFMTTLMPSNFLINTTNSTATNKALTANMGKTLAGDLATVQTSATASKSYAVGEYLVLNGQLYKVTSAIANGGTITVGTNVTATNAGSQLKSLNDSLVRRYTNAYTFTTANDTYCFGFVSGGGLDLAIIIPCVIESRLTPDDLQITQLILRMRLPAGGYIGGSNSFDATSYISLVWFNAQGIVIVVKKSDGWGVTNNIPLVGSVAMNATFT